MTDRNERRPGSAAQRSSPRHVSIQRRCGSSLPNCSACGSDRGSHEHVLRPTIAARIFISSSLHKGHEDLKTLSSRFASICLVIDDGGQSPPHQGARSLKSQTPPAMAFMGSDSDVICSISRRQSGKRMITGFSQFNAPASIC